MSNETSFKVGDPVTYTDRGGTRTGEIIEINAERTRARIKWQLTGRNLRTWVRVSALVLKGAP